MKRNLYLILIVFSIASANAQIPDTTIDTDAHRSFKTGNDVLNYLYQKYKSGPCKSYIFSQKNKHYRNDSVVGTSEWHEAIEFPDKFRIDFGNKAEGNFVIFKNDSSYRYKKSELVKTTYDTNVLLLLLGGMYYRTIENVNLRLQKENFNTTLLSTQLLNKQTYYVIGAQQGDTTSNQVWVHKKTWRVYRIIEKMENGHTMDMTFDDHQKHCNGFTETKVTFKDNGKIKQQEDYFDIKAVDSFPKEIFNPGK